MVDGIYLDTILVLVWVSRRLFDELAEELRLEFGKLEALAED